MTLVIAHKLNRHISLSSDSRISFGSAGYIDYGIKVFSVPVKIYSPTSSETNVTDLDYDYKLGLAVVGSSMNAYTVKESVYEILQNLQYVPGYTDLSMDGIANLVFKVFNKITLDLGSILQKNGMCGLILAGYCPIQNKIRIFNFTCDITTHPIQPFFNEILKNDGMLFLGSGQTEAERIYTENNLLSPLHIIKKVVRQDNVATVGGGLQYGEFEMNSFKIFGVADFDLNNDGTFKEDIYTLRGVNIYKDDFERASDGFHIAYTFKMPFEDERDAIFKSQIGNL